MPWNGQNHNSLNSPESIHGSDTSPESSGLRRQNILNLKIFSPSFVESPMGQAAEVISLNSRESQNEGAGRSDSRAKSSHNSASEVT